MMLLFLQSFVVLILQLLPFLPCSALAWAGVGVGAGAGLLLLPTSHHHPRRRRVTTFARITAAASLSKAEETSVMPTNEHQQQQQEEKEQRMMEAIVCRYFQGVDEKNAQMIRSCFGEKDILIRDVIGGNNSQQVAMAKTVNANDMVQRCMDFVTAHPDVRVHFHIPPTCLRSRRQQQQQQQQQPNTTTTDAATTITDSTTTSANANIPSIITTNNDYYWVFAHWYETGTWTGESCGLEPNHKPMNVEGQTRFRVDSKTEKIVELVVTRTFTEWEQAFLKQQVQQQ
mmetsp:Transcript_11578/g.15252  ORF Transcript_11578/g.15252 Transcript_11578/m.15252 type:complete len:286 (+) Transcript_11578:60-917(+)